MRESREAATTLCGTLAGAELVGGMSGKDYDMIINETTGGVLTEEHISSAGEVAFFDGEGNGSPLRRNASSGWKQFSRIKSLL